MGALLLVALPIVGQTSLPVLDTLCTAAAPSHLAVAHQPGYHYTWQVSGGSIISPPDSSRIKVDWTGPAGPHLVQVFATNPRTGCQSLARQAYIYLQAPAQATAKAPKKVCAGTRVRMVSTTRGPYRWNNGLQDSVLSFVAYRDTVVKLIALNPGCGNDTMALHLSVVSQPQARLSHIPDTLPLQEVLFVYYPNVPQNLKNVVWHTTEHDSVKALGTELSFTTPGWHTITQVVSNGICTDTLQKDIFISDFYSAYFPNVFTPNGDGRNEIWNFKGKGHLSWRAQIYNRWGELVYQWDNSSGKQGWDGIEQGRPALQSTYVYKVRITDLTGRVHYYNNSFTLIR